MLVTDRIEEAQKKKTSYETLGKAHMSWRHHACGMVGTNPSSRKRSEETTEYIKVIPDT